MAALIAALALAGCGSSSSSSKPEQNPPPYDASTSSGSSGGGSSGGGSSSGSGSSGGGGSSSGGTLHDGAAPKDGGGSYPPLTFSSIGTAMQVSGTQFYFTEGPVWDPSLNVLYFTDINGDPGATPGGVVYKLTPPATVEVLFQPSGNADGLGLDPQGNLLGAGFVSRDVWRRPQGGTMTTIGACTQGGGTCYGSSEINTPDDVAARSDGVIYFTDPTFASGGQGFPTLTLPLSNAQGIYRVTTDGVLHLEDSTTGGPNGVNLSPDEKTLYVSYTLGGTVSKFAVAADGSLSNKTTFATGATVADSMCVDAGGNVYVGTLSGLAVYDPTGKHLGTISAGGNIVTNCAFGGADQKTLYITARTSATLSGAPPLGGGLLYAISAMPVPGMPGRN